MNEPSPRLAEANDMELATTHSPPSLCWHAFGVSVSAAAMFGESNTVLLSYRRLDSVAFCLYGPTLSVKTGKLRLYNTSRDFVRSTIFVRRTIERQRYAGSAVTRNCNSGDLCCSLGFPI